MRRVALWALHLALFGAGDGGGGFQQAAWIIGIRFVVSVQALGFRGLELGLASLSFVGFGLSSYVE